VVNFAQGTFAVVAGLGASWLLGTGLPHGVSEVAAVLLATATGLLTGLVAIGKRGTTPQSSLIITLGVGVLAYAIEIFVWGDQPRSFPGLPGSLTVAGIGIQRQHLLVIVATAVTFALLTAFFGRTYLGKALSACASNPYAARVIGIDVTKMGLLAFALGGLLGGVAGALVGALLLGVAESMAAGYGYAAYQTELALGLMLVLMVVQSTRRRATVLEESA
jgi:branched-chain amino acid transport system permease protein